jgi:hypothetical protein
VQSETGFQSGSILPWLCILIVDVVIGLAGIVYTICTDSPRLPGYMHLLVTYHFGFTRRALIGTIVSWLTDVVPLWYVYGIAIVAWIITVSLFVATFRKIFGFKEDTFPLFVFMAGSPFENVSRAGRQRHST